MEIDKFQKKLIKLLAYNAYFHITYLFFLHTIVLKVHVLYERKPMQNYRPDNSIDDFSLAMAYVPWQHFNRLYENMEEAYQEGTIFPELNKPFMGRRCVNGK